MEGQAFIRLALHLAGVQILSEATLAKDMRWLLEQAGVAVGLRVDVNTADIMRTLALAVRTGEAPLADPMNSTFGGAVA